MVCGGASHRISLSLYQCRDLFSLNFHPSISIISIIQRSWVSKKPETKRPSHWLQHYRGLSRPTPSVSRLKPCFNFLEPLCGASRESVNMAWPQVASDLRFLNVLHFILWVRQWICEPDASFAFDFMPNIGRGLDVQHGTLLQTQNVEVSKIFWSLCSINNCFLAPEYTTEAILWRYNSIWVRVCRERGPFDWIMAMTWCEPIVNSAQYLIQPWLYANLPRLNSPPILPTAVSRISQPPHRCHSLYPSPVVSLPKLKNGWLNTQFGFYLLNRMQLHLLQHIHLKMLDHKSTAPCMFLLGLQIPLYL